MRALVTALFVAATVAFTAQAFAQGAGGGGAAGGTGGAGGTSTGGTAGAAGAGTVTSSPSSTTVPVQPQAPLTEQTNPGITPSAPGPSTAKTPPDVSPNVPQPGYASSHRQPRAQDVPQGDANSPDAIKELDRELDRKLSICRGC